MAQVSLERTAYCFTRGEVCEARADSLERLRDAEAIIEQYRQPKRIRDRVCKFLDQLVDEVPTELSQAQNTAAEQLATLRLNCNRTCIVEEAQGAAEWHANIKGESRPLTLRES